MVGTQTDTKEIPKTYCNIRVFSAPSCWLLKGPGWVKRLETSDDRRLVPGRGWKGGWRGLPGGIRDVVAAVVEKAVKGFRGGLIEEWDGVGWHAAGGIRSSGAVAR